MAPESKTCVLVGRRIGLHQDRAFVVKGIFTGADAKKKAEALCKDEWWFCLKVDMNKDLKMTSIPWSETWNPLKAKK